MLLQKLLVFVPWFIKAKERDVEAGRQLQEYANSFVRDVVAQSLNEENVDSVSERVATLLHEFPSVQFHERHHDSLLFVTSYIHCLIEKIRKTEKEAELQDFVAQFVLNVCLPQLQNWPNEQQVQPASKEEDQAVTMLQKHVCFILATHATEHVEVANMLFKECESSLETSAHEDSSKYHVPALLSLIACILLTVQHKVCVLLCIVVYYCVLLCIIVHYCSLLFIIVYYCALLCIIVTLGCYFSRRKSSSSRK